MSTFWVVVIIVFVLGIILGNIMLLRYSSKFKIPKDFKKRPDSDYDKDDDADKW
ncbi:DUF2897 family protein [Glaciecola siphonariae]|uniref:DUF2897 family protein n=1 Tax=Glaciecola siphonariae TaxID=521012 RepID=A0ABV9LUN0_9ALTE